MTIELGAVRKKTSMSSELGAVRKKVGKAVDHHDAQKSFLSM